MAIRRTIIFIIALMLCLTGGSLLWLAFTMSERQGSFTVMGILIFGMGVGLFLAPGRYDPWRRALREITGTISRPLKRAGFVAGVVAAVASTAWVTI